MYLHMITAFGHMGHNFAVKKLARPGNISYFKTSTEKPEGGGGGG